MITMIVNTLLVFYYEKMIGYMPPSFVDLVFAGERIEVGLRRGKFDYASTTSSGNRRPGANRAKKKEGETHKVIATLTWPSSSQTPHNPMYQYPPLKFNWIGLLPIQLNLIPTTNIKYSLNACEITKLPIIQKLV